MFRWLRELVRDGNSQFLTGTNAANEVLGRQLIDRISEGDAMPGVGAPTDEYASLASGLAMVYGAISVRTAVISRMVPAVLSTETGSFHDSVVRDSALERLIRRPSSDSTLALLLRMIETSLCIWGRCYLVYDGVELLFKPVSTMARSKNSPMFFEEKIVGADTVLWPQRSVIAMAYPSPGGAEASSPMTAALSAARTANLALEYNTRFFYDSARPDFLFLTEQALTDREVDSFYERWDARHQGKNRRPAVANFVREVVRLGLTQQDIDFVNGLQWNVKDVSRAFAVPLPMLSEFGDASLSNVMASERFFWRNLILPELHFICEALSLRLPLLVGEPSYSLTYDRLAMPEVWELDSDVRVGDQGDVDRGILTINEIRQRRGMPDVAWGGLPPWERTVNELPGDSS